MGELSSISYSGAGDAGILTLYTIDLQLLVSLTGTIAFVLSLLLGPGLLMYPKRPRISIGFKTKVTGYYSQRVEFDGEIRQPSRECFKASYLFVKLENKKGLFSDNATDLEVSCFIKGEDIKIDLIAVDFDDYRLKGGVAVVTPNMVRGLDDDKKCLSNFYDQVFGSQIRGVLQGDILYYPLFKSASVINSMRLYTNQSILVERKKGEEANIVLIVKFTDSHRRRYTTQKGYVTTLRDNNDYMVREAAPR